LPLVPFPDEHLLGFAMEALDQFHQVVDRHRQIEALAALLPGPADVRQQAEVFAELVGELLGLGVVLGLLQRVPKVAYGAEVVADELVEPVALLAVDRDRGGVHWRPSSR